MAQANMKPRYRWIPLQRCTTFKPVRESLVATAMAHLGLDRAGAIEALAEHHDGSEFWVNDLYQCQARPLGERTFQIIIRRRDGGPILRDWRHFQNIKNEILGPECEAVELYPAESRLVDTSNKFHLWGTRDPTYRFPMGFEAREVSYDDGDDPGTRQRPL